MFDNRVLLVEDDPDTREITGLLLGHAGYEVIVAADPAAGIKLADEHPDIGFVIADMYFGNGQTCMEMAERFKASNADTRFILTSGDPEAARVASRMDLMYLPKPYGRVALLAIMDEARNRRAAAR